MFMRNKKTDKEIFIEQLYVVRDWALECLDALDPDIDDVIHRMYYAAFDLIAILDPQEVENCES